MRIDEAHQRRIAGAVYVGKDGEPAINLDLHYMSEAMDRLSLWEQGLLAKTLVRAARTKKRTPEQRILLALFLPVEV